MSHAGRGGSSMPEVVHEIFMGIMQTRKYELLAVWSPSVKLILGESNIVSGFCLLHNDDQRGASRSYVYRWSTLGRRNST